MKLEEYKPLTEYKAINWNEVSDMIDKATVDTFNYYHKIICERKL